MSTPEEYSAVVAHNADHAEIRVRGELDVYTAAMLRQLLTELLDGGDANLVVDLSALSYIDSTGLGVLVGGLKRAREMGGDLRLRNPNAQAANVFEITGLTKVFTIE